MLGSGYMKLGWLYLCLSLFMFCILPFLLGLDHTNPGPHTHSIIAVTGSEIIYLALQAAGLSWYVSHTLLTYPMTPIYFVLLAICVFWYDSWIYRVVFLPWHHSLVSICDLHHPYPDLL